MRRPRWRPVAPDALTSFAILAVLALIGPLVLAGWVRRDEVHGREPRSAVASAMRYGAVTGVLLGLLFHLVFDLGYSLIGSPLGLGSAFFVVVVGAPFGEELAKGLGLGLRRHRIKELEDGIVYGVAIGLGFAATENLVYGMAALLDSGFQVAVGTVVMRTFSSMLLHAAASGILGFGYAVVVRRGGVAAEAIPYYLMAVLLHALYNYLVYARVAAGLVLATVIVVAVVVVLRRRIRYLDALPHGTS